MFRPAALEETSFPRRMRAELIEVSWSERTDGVMWVNLAGEVVLEGVGLLLVAVWQGAGLYGQGLCWDGRFKE